MKGKEIVVGVFEFADDTIHAIQAIKQEGFDIKVYSPVPVPEIMDVVTPYRSPVRFITGTGAITGIIFGFSLASWTSLDWPLRVSAKNIVAPPSFIPVGYECTILFGALSTLVAMIVLCKLPGIFPSSSIGFDPRFSSNRFGVVVGCDEKSVEGVKKKLNENGAEEVINKSAL